MGIIEGHFRIESCSSIMFLDFCGVLGYFGWLVLVFLGVFCCCLFIFGVILFVLPLHMLVPVSAQSDWHLALTMCMKLDNGLPLNNSTWS